MCVCVCVCVCVPERALATSLAVAHITPTTRTTPALHNQHTAARRHSVPTCEGSLRLMQLIDISAGGGTASPAAAPVSLPPALPPPGWRQHCRTTLCAVSDLPARIIECAIGGRGPGALFSTGALASTDNPAPPPADTATALPNIASWQPEEQAVSRQPHLCQACR